jgi:hypothetical protein
VLVHATVPSTIAGHRKLLILADRLAPGHWVWAVEGALRMDSG